MKKSLFAVGITIATLTAIFFLIPREYNSVRADQAAATPAPTATKGPPVTADSEYTLLDKPLEKEQAIARTLEIDKQFAAWKDPWSLETSQNEPDRIMVEWYSDRTYDGGEYGPGAELGPVWVITIKGAVRLLEENEPDNYHDGLTYRVAQNSGHLLSYSAGPWIK